MARKSGTKALQLDLTPDQHTALNDLRGDEPLAQYIRRLIREDAKQRGIEWPDNMPGWGGYRGFDELDKSALEAEKHVEGLK